MTRLPPPRVIRAVNRLRNGLQHLTRTMVPPEVGLLELASGFMATHAIYAAAKLGIADTLVGGPLSANDIAAGSGRIQTAPIGCSVRSRRSASSPRSPTGAST